jgi:hypothetical protein
MASSPVAAEVKYRGLTYKSENKKYNVKVSLRQGELERTHAKHRGLKGGISGGYFTDPQEAAQLADR